jgi:putative mRNA 3-end processing factor
MSRRRPGPRAFRFRAGVHLEGTHLTCDARSSATDVVFLSHAQGLGVLGARRAPAPRVGRQELLATEQTLALLGRRGERLRRFALPAVFGRPFVLGGLRVELLSAGHVPGSASLFVEVEDRRLLYAGTVRRGTPGFGAAPLALRTADAVCVEGTFGSPRFVFPPQEEALALVVQFAQASLAAGRSPVLLVPPFSSAFDVAVALGRAGLTARAHRGILGLAALYRSAGVTPPRLLRFAGRLAPEEVLLWPPDARESPLLGALESPRFAFVSGFSLDPETHERMRADVGIALSNQAGFPDLLKYVEETGAEEVAVHRGFADELAEHLRARRLEAYSVGPPRQLELFRG